MFHQQLEEIPTSGFEVFQHAVASSCSAINIINQNGTVKVESVDDSSEKDPGSLKHDGEAKIDEICSSEEGDVKIFSAIRSTISIYMQGKIFSNCFTNIFLF